MYAAKSTLFLAIFAASTQLVAALPPACLLAAINTESNPADLPTLCGSDSDSSKVQAQIKQLCGGNTDAAMKAYKETCGSAGKTDELLIVFILATSSGSESSSTTSSSSSSSTGSDSSSTVTTSTGSVDTSAPYPIVYTSTYYDTVCSCTKTTAVSSSGVAGSTGFATGTGAPLPTGTGSSGTVTGSGAVSGPSATGSPITPVAPKGTGPAPFTGAATRTVGSFAAAGMAFMALALAL
ncbi:MAG: hypothetical protein Q9170_006215 [Blastenia crenularia]